MEREILIREITTIAEMRGVEELQKEVWRVPDIEVVPYSHLIAATAAGGSLIGAFDGEIPVGFAYGFVSYEKGQMAHHSHMLAVKPEYRSAKLGERLKRAQREFVLRQGVSLMSWTFDPLQSLNAYFNFNKLGVISDQYFVDFYGDDAPSFLHQNSTDRLWVIWNLKEEKNAPEVDFEKVKRLVRLDEKESPQVFEMVEGEARLAIEIPENINELQEAKPELAVRWRQATRNAFVRAFEKGFAACGFYRMNRATQNFGVYLLERKNDYERKK